ncbi:uncharacterized protein N7459_000942 [Penicillium hispanicum]|uniref:uncharacterized protein n=1 Tax=Penicillium hispanicum TaxID=1080232 RepID=UPI0025426478|nr:uncharacterized protein N7459_000942 [Penicillium hispanicum]KAJ5594734.1 hypothetical protein N7459_000942 [Penicillium hispanicum]
MRNIDSHRSQNPATRRNGSLQSCEPCRRSKQRCGHERPVCRRCARKRINDKCFYHPAPMTRQTTSEHGSASLGAASRLSSQPTSTASSPRSLSSGRLFAPLEPPSALPGYLGSTSFTAVLSEHRSEIPFEPEESTESSPVLSVQPDRIQSGAELLLFLYNLDVREKLIGQFCHDSWNMVVPKVIMDVILKSIREIFDGFDPQNLMPRLQSFATQIFHNSSRPLVTHGSMNIDEYCASFTGRNFRWEALGNIFSVCGQQLVVTPDNDPHVTQGTDDPRAKDSLLEQVTVASTTCISLCDQASAANELLAFLQYNDVMLRTQQYGDSSYQAWRRLGDLVATIYAAGLHLDTESTDSCPFFLRQWRRGCFSSAFYMDKMMATFVGRPPLINYRYCTLVPPLDLSDEVLVASGDALDQAITELDSAGWNTRGARHRMSSSRLRFQLSIFREQALEIALGTRGPDDMIRKSNKIQERIRTVWEAAPDHFRYDRLKSDDQQGGQFNIVHFYLNYLYTCFLLHRAIVKHTNAEKDSLCDVSRRVLALVISFGSMRTPMIDLDRHISWIVRPPQTFILTTRNDFQVTDLRQALTYGLPCASVLLLELLHQSHGSGLGQVGLPRAELIRNLSVFISMLGWVSRPGHGNYRACKEAEKKLSRILDQVLDPQAVQADVLHDVTSGLSDFLDWSNYSTWDFSSDYLSANDGIVP